MHLHLYNVRSLAALRVLHSLVVPLNHKLAFFFDEFPFLVVSSDKHSPIDNPKHSAEEPRLIFLVIGVLLLQRSRPIPTCD